VEACSAKKNGVPFGPERHPTVLVVCDSVSRPAMNCGARPFLYAPALAVFVNGAVRRASTTRLKYNR
jgi:hypothetical protein